MIFLVFERSQFRYSIQTTFVPPHRVQLRLAIQKRLFGPKAQCHIYSAGRAPALFFVRGVSEFISGRSSTAACLKRDIFSTCRKDPPCQSLHFYFFYPGDLSKTTVPVLYIMSSEKKCFYFDVPELYMSSEKCFHFEVARTGDFPHLIHKLNLPAVSGATQPGSSTLLWGEPKRCHTAYSSVVL